MLNTNDTVMKKASLFKTKVRRLRQGRAGAERTPPAGAHGSRTP